mmetsp:Transcript_10471/g.20328  ORF Transcript_10471/g.20328 Transcript_10471/m.20328 type:complete len:256 (-) Transcript_10471:362-1129(-)
MPALAHLLLSFPPVSLCFLAVVRMGLRAVPLDTFCTRVCCWACLCLGTSGFRASGTLRSRSPFLRSPPIAALAFPLRDGETARVCEEREGGSGRGLERELVGFSSFACRRGREGGGVTRMAGCRGVSRVLLPLPASARVFLSLPSLSLILRSDDGLEVGAGAWTSRKIFLGACSFAWSRGGCGTETEETASSSAPDGERLGGGGTVSVAVCAVRLLFAALSSPSSSSSASTGFSSPTPIFITPLSSSACAGRDGE